MAGKTYLLFSHVCNAEHMTGAEKYLLFLLQELLPFRRAILVVPNEGLLAREARSLGSEVVVHPYPLIWQMWDPGPNLHEEEQHFLQSPELTMLMNLLHMQRPDAVIVGTCVNPLPAMAASRLGIPVLWIMTEVMRDGPHTPQSISLIHRYSTWVGGISDSTLSPFHRSGIGWKTIMLNPSWRADRLHPATWQEQRRRLRAAYAVSEQDVLTGYIVSDIAPHKGFDHFVEMAVRLSHTHPDAHFMIVGQATDQAYYDSTMQYLHQSGFASRFKLIPYNSSIEAIYPAMDLIVVPSLVPEGFGMIALEGMIFGKPVIAYRSGGLEEILTKCGMSSLLVAPGDITQLTATVSTLIRSPQSRYTLGRKSQQAVDQVYGIEAYRSRLQLMLQIIDPALDEVEQHHAHTRTSIPDGSILTGTHTPAVFLVQGGRKRPFASEAAFLGHGFNWQQIMTVDEAVLQWFPNGAPVM